jgi:hypothetical protein
MVSISTVLLEVHWLASPAPQPKPIVQASPPPASKTEGPNAALNPVYPTKLDAPRPTESNAQAQNTSAGTAPATGQAAPASQAPAAPASRTSPAQQPAPAASTTPEQQASPATQSPPAQQPVTAQPAAAPQSQAQAALAQAPTPQPSGTNERSRQSSSAETTGIGGREDSTRQAVANPTGSTSRNDNPQQTPQGSSSNRCDIQACANAYRSFRVSDCTYQSFDGQRRFCGKPPGQQMAREQREQRERRRWSRDTDVRYLDRSTVGRRLDDDGDAELDDSDRGPPGFFFFGRRPRW